jgi:alcohol dehydrogenase (cytochrome c)
MLKIESRLSARAGAWTAGLLVSGIAVAAFAQPPPPLVIEPNRDAAYQGIAQGREKLLQNLTPVDDAMHKTPPPGDWLNWRRTYDGYGHSPLKQINRSNVSKLQLAWSWTLPQSVNETTPLVHDGVIFVASGGRVQAFDGSNGDLLWQYTRSAPNASAIAAFALVKSMGIAANRLFVSTLDRHMIALDVRSGAVLWDTPGAEEAAIKPDPPSMAA